MRIYHSRRRCPISPDQIFNRLANETSPYLLQHARNPVNWFPWESEAFETAKREDKPIFLSIGYSTCHWCHVMAHESFEDTEVAKLLNRSFICIKVDREERPDVDAVYMNACQVLTGSGGWPLTIVMTPNQQPFYAGTYLPKQGRGGMVGLTELLEVISRQWETDRPNLLKAGAEITGFLQEQAGEQPARTALSLAPLRQSFGQFRQRFDAQNGGFGHAPKFPSPHNLLFLLRYGEAEGQPEALSMAEKTLAHMYRGGIFDHIGGGFSRYSTDARYLVPHFEKMLYDNALLALAYAEAARVTGRELYASVARRTLDYVLRELTDEGGGFYSAQDADSDGVEGKYYVFTPGEIAGVLGEEPARRICGWYGITPEGNFEGRSIPNLLDNPAYATPPDAELTAAQAMLYRYRLTRTSLHRDDKILTAWNGLMVAALARAYALLGDGAYLTAARRAENFLWGHLTRPDGTLMVSYRQGKASGEGKLDDYAFLTWGLLELYAATFDAAYLTRACALADRMTDCFFDAEHGGFYLYARQGEQLLTRPKEAYDGALPSGNSVAAYALQKLFALTGEEKFRSLAQKQLGYVAACAQDYPAGLSFGLLALSLSLYPSQELICVLPDDAPTDAVLAYAQEHPSLTVLVKTPANAAALIKAAPFTAGYPLGREAYYLCQNGACAAPADSLAQLPQ